MQRDVTVRAGNVVDAGAGQGQMRGDFRSPLTVFDFPEIFGQH